MNWLRLWHEMPTDPKWRTIARRSGQTISTVIAVYNFLLVNASANSEGRGTLKNWSSEDVASSLDISEEDVEAILREMQDRVLDGDRLTGWEKRQPKREDDSSERVKKHRQRERQNAASNEAKRDVTQSNAEETDLNAPEKIQRREENIHSTCAREGAILDSPHPNPVVEMPTRAVPLGYDPLHGFELWYADYVRKTGKAVNDKDCKKAEFEWRRLDFEQRKNAYDFIDAMVASGKYSGPEMYPLPANYLRDTPWTRKSFRTEPERIRSKSVTDLYTNAGDPEEELRHWRESLRRGA